MSRIIIAFILATVPCLASSSEQSVICDSCQLAGHFRNIDQTSFAIKIEDAIFASADAGDVKSWRGVTQGPPNRFTKMVDVRIGGVAVKIPLRAYSDLGNPLIPSSIALTRNQDEIFLNLSGGEGSAAYTARFVILNGKLVRREVSSPATPDAKPDVMTFD
ncbi:MAG: hypothetical protein WCH43_11480 [Verrucomicrobiota bacterium]